MFTGSHPEEGTLELYVMGKLDEPVVESIEEHLLLCASCQDRLEATEIYIRSMKSALGRAEAARPWRTRVGGWFQMPVPAWAAVAALVLLVIGGLVGVRYFSAARTPVAVMLTAARGETASVAAKGPLDLTLDAREMPVAATYRVQLVNGEGAGIWEQRGATVQDGYIHVRIGKHLSAGQYFVRLFASDASTPREYALEIR